MKNYVWLILLIMLLAACQGGQTEDTDSTGAITQQATSTAAVDPAEVEAVEIQQPTEMADPTNVPSPPPDPSPTVSEAAENQDGEQPTSTAAAAEPAVQVNGRYETTYFRGQESAPVTIIDYSDFL